MGNFGIEVGGHDSRVSKEFQAKVNENRRLLLEEYATIDINKIIRMINDSNRISNYTDNTSGEYLLIKYFKILKCIYEKLIIISDIQCSLLIIWLCAIISKQNI